VWVESWSLDLGICGGDVVLVEGVQSLNQPIAAVLNPLLSKAMLASKIDVYLSGYFVQLHPSLVSCDSHVMPVDLSG